MKKLLLLISFILYTLYFILSHGTPVFAAPIVPPEKIGAAAGTWYVQPPDVWQQKVFGVPSTSTTGGGGGGSSGFGPTTGTDQNAMFLERYVVAIGTSFANMIATGVEGSRTQIAQGPNGPVYSYQGGATSLLAGLTGNLYTTPPASSIEYLADLGNNLGIVKPAYAQGLGFSAFSPVLKIWKAFRDIAYLGFVIVFVIIGFMIMFRRKIDPRTVVTVQEALPKIVVALILVTFSYAIAGLIIDMIMLSMQVVANLFTATGLIAIPRTDITGHPEFRTSQGILNQLYNATIFQLMRPLASSEGISTVIANTASWSWGDLSADALHMLGWLSFRVVFAILGFFVMFKIFFALLGPYVTVVLSIIFAPIQLLMGAIPGNNDVLLKWIKGLLANAAVFPVAFAMLLLAAIFKSDPNTCGLWLGPNGEGGTLTQGLGCASNAFYSTSKEYFSINWGILGFGGTWGNAVGQIIGFGILFTIPAVAEMVKGALEGKEMPVSQIAGQEIKGGFGRIPLLGSILPK